MLDDENDKRTTLWGCNAIANKQCTSSANRTNLFEDNTADEFISGMTVGLFNLQLR